MDDIDNRQIYCFQKLLDIPEHHLTMYIHEHQHIASWGEFRVYQRHQDFSKNESSRIPQLSYSGDFLNYYREPFQLQYYLHSRRAIMQEVIESG